MTGVLKTMGDYFELDKYQNEIAPQFQKNQEMIKQMVDTKERECLNKYLEDEEKFVECMRKNEERVKRAMKNLDYGLMYWKQKTYECFHREAYKQKDEKDFQKCKPIANFELEEIFQSFRL